MVGMRNICPKCGRPYAKIAPCPNCGYYVHDYDILNMNELI